MNQLAEYDIPEIDLVSLTYTHSELLRHLRMKLLKKLILVAYPYPCNIKTFADANYCCIAEAQYAPLYGLLEENGLKVLIEQRQILCQEPAVCFILRLLLSSTILMDANECWPFMHRKMKALRYGEILSINVDFLRKIQRPCFENNRKENISATIC